jgi:hypothetical protein
MVVKRILKKMIGWPLLLQTTNPNHLQKDRQKGLTIFAADNQPEPSSKERAKGIDDKRTHADIAEETRRKDKAEKEKNRVAVEQAMTIGKMRKKDLQRVSQKGKKEDRAGDTLEKHVQRDKEPTNHVSESEDDFEVEEWKCVEHRSVNSKPQFTVSCGKRKGGEHRHVWGSCVEMKTNEMVGLDDQTTTECPDVAMHTNLLRPTKKGRPKERTRKEKNQTGSMQSQDLPGPDNMRRRAERGLLWKGSLHAWVVEVCRRQVWGCFFSEGGQPTGREERSGADCCWAHLLLHQH